MAGGKKSVEVEVLTKFKKRPINGSQVVIRYTVTPSGNSNRPFRGRLTGTWLPIGIEADSESVQRLYLWLFGRSGCVDIGVIDVFARIHRAITIQTAPSTQKVTKQG